MRRIKRTVSVGPSVNRPDSKTYASEDVPGEGSWNRAVRYPFVFGHRRSSSAPAVSPDFALTSRRSPQRPIAQRTISAAIACSAHARGTAVQMKSGGKRPMLNTPNQIRPKIVIVRNEAAAKACATVRPAQLKYSQ